jgi:hypothetical protein
MPLFGMYTIVPQPDDTGIPKLSGEGGKMKSKTLALLGGITLLALLSTPIRPTAQEQIRQAEHAGNPDTGTSNPVPLINQPLVPDAVAPGGAGFTLTVNGTGFVSGSVVNWNGSALVTTFVSSSQLTAAVAASDIATASTASVTVVNPSPGGGTSNVAFFSVAAAQTSVVFSLTASLSVGSNPQSVATGDFNGDGKLDLVDANFFSNTVSVLLGDGTGNFTRASSPATGSFPVSVAIADFNGDGKLDLAVANQQGNTVSVLLGDGTGNFTLASSPSTGSGPQSVAVADFNGDGKLDLAVANSESNTVSVLLGDGTGNFTLASSPTTGSGPTSVAVGDFNGDGRLDLAVVNSESNTVSVLLGDGTGNFTLASSPATGIYPISVAVGDFDGDGKLDLAVGNNNDSTVSVLLGDGAGNFTLASSPATGDRPYWVAVGDFNGDGRLDLAVANQQGNTVSVLLGDGTGNFTLASSPATGSNPPSSVAVGDFNGDGHLDLAVTNFSVSVLLQVTGPLAVLSPTSLNFGTQVIGTASAGQTVTLSNTGVATLDITSITASANFVEGTTCGSSLAAGSSCKIGVKFRPSGVGTDTGTLTVTDNAPGSPQTVSLTGVGTAVTLSPTSLNFGNQAVGTTSSAQTVTFTNHAKGTLRISGVRFTGRQASDFAQTNTCGSSVAAGSNCTFSVTFTPGATGSRTATLNVGDNGGASPQTVALSGTGT